MVRKGKGARKMDLPPPPPKWPYLLSMIVYLAIAVLAVVVNRESLAIYYDIVFGTTTSRSAIQQRALLAGLPIVDSSGDNNGKLEQHLTMQQAADKLCDIGIALNSVSSCFAAPESPDESFELTLINTSPYHVDILWDSDGTGGSGATQNIGNVEGNGASMKLTVFKDNQFLLVLHADEAEELATSSDESAVMTQRMVDPITRKQHGFQTSKQGQTFVIPKSATPMVF